MNNPILSHKFRCVINGFEYFTQSIVNVRMSATDKLLTIELRHDDNDMLPDIMTLASDNTLVDITLQTFTDNDISDALKVKCRLSYHTIKFDYAVQSPLSHHLEFTIL